MKIALVRYRYNPYGGAERFVEQALQAIRMAGAHPTVICRDWDSDRELPDVDVLAVGGGGGWSRQARDMDFERRVKTAIASHSFDLVQTHERIPGCDIFRAGDGVHRVWLQQRARLQSAASRWLTSIDPYHRFMLDRERRMFEHPGLRAVICNSNMVADEIRGHFRIDPSRLRLIRNCVDAGRFHPPSTDERMQARSATGVPAEAPLFVYVGSGFKRKGVRALLRALARAPRCHALIIGDDKHRARYEKFALDTGVAGRAHFKGAQKDVRSFLWAADAMVFPTLYDPCPNAVLEAMACALPVITSHQCGAAELLVHGGSGWVVDALDIGGIAAGMLHFSEQAVAHRAGQEALTAIAPYSPARMGRELNDLYRELLLAP